MIKQNRKLFKKLKHKELYRGVLNKFCIGDWVFGLGEHKGCSPIFEGYGHLQPFSYLDDYNAEDFRLATKQEIEESAFNNCI